MQHTLTNALPIVAAAYGRKFGIPVQVGGDQARTDGRIIQIPTIPETPSGKTLAFGYLAHEAGHVRYTDFDLSRHEKPLGRHIENILEDVRIEAEMLATYPGARNTLDAVIDTLIDQGKLSAVNPTDKPLDVMCNGLLHLARHQYRHQSALASHAKQADRVMRQTLGSRFFNRLQGLMSEIPRLNSTAASIDLAKRIVALVEDEAQDHDQDDQSQDDQAQGSENSDQSQAGQAEDGGSMESSTESQTQRHASQAEDGENQSQGSKSQAHGTQSERLDTQTALQAVMDATEAELPEDIFQEVAETLSDQSYQSPTPTLLPTLEEYNGDMPLGVQALHRVQAHSAKLTARLQGLIEAHTLEKRRAARRGRTLSAQHLHRAAVADPRIFRVKERKVAPNTALHLLVDLSGSMAGSEAVLALDAAMALALALEPVRGVTRAVTAFPSIEGNDDQVTRILSHGDRVANRAGAFAQHGRGGTPMTGALWFGAADLLARPEPRKVLLTLTDGVPNDSVSAADMITKASAAGIEMIGIGIAIDVSRLFPVAIRINDIADLKTELFKIAEQLLLTNHT